MPICCIKQSLNRPLIKTKWKWYGFLLLGLLSSVQSMAQTYPLQLTVTIPPPYTNRWQDYTGSNCQARLIIRKDSPQSVGTQQTILAYRPSQSKDVAETGAEWRSEKQSNWNRFQLANSRRLEDTAILNFIPVGSMVEVRLVAIDSTGLSSPPSAWANIKIPINSEQHIGNWQIKADTTTKALIINWEKPFERKIQVLIAESSRSLQTQKAAEGQQQKTAITGLKPGNQYRIALRLVSPTGEWITETRTTTLTEP